jgi:hypothetical protein
MEITLQKSNQLKAIAILMMLCLHLFNRDYHNLFEPILFVGTQPLSYYISLFCDACVPIFCFVSGYGLFFNYQKNNVVFNKTNRKRLLKLYINYWIILLLFAVGLGFALGKEGYPGNLMKFLLNFSGLDNSYNGAWWFFTTYIILVLTSIITFKWVVKYSYLAIVIGSLLYYVVAFYFRVYRPIVFDVELLNWLQRQICLFGTSFFPFIAGAIALKEQWNTKITAGFQKIKLKNLVALSGISMLIVMHGIVPSFIVAPFLAIPFIFLFLQLKLPQWLDNVFDFLAPHATNMWLIHMFFYMIYFENFIYSGNYVPLIFLLLVGICLVCSFVINKINTIILTKVHYN